MDYNLEALAAMTDLELDDLIRGLRHGNGYIMPHPLGEHIAKEMERRDPSGTRLWGGPPPQGQPGGDA